MGELDDKIKERISKWLESLNETEKSQVEVLDAYFTFRTNLPGEDPGMGKPIEEPKTTDEIIDDLTPIMPLSSKVVVGYMRSHGFGLTTIADGSVKWAVWRFIDITVLT